MKLKDDSDQLPNTNDRFLGWRFFKLDNDLDQIAPTELQLNIDLQDTDRHWGEEEEIITQTKIYSTASHHGSDKWYGHIREVGTKLQFSSEKSHPNLEHAWEEEDNITHINSDDLNEEVSTLVIHCSDPGQQKKDQLQSKIRSSRNVPIEKNIIGNRRIARLIQQKVKITIITVQIFILKKRHTSKLINNKPTKIDTLT